jgi:hypothetical protein
MQDTEIKFELVNTGVLYGCVVVTGSCSTCHGSLASGRQVRLPKESRQVQPMMFSLFFSDNKVSDVNIDLQVCEINPVK